MIKAVAFDLDDTLFPEYEYVKSGFRAVAECFGRPQLYDEMVRLFHQDKNDVYSRAGLSQTECDKAVSVYRNHFPDISLNKETKLVLDELKKRGYLLGIITDGRPAGQRRKLEALGLDSLMDYIIITDEFGGVEYRKPHKKPFEVMRERLCVSFDEMMYIGDNPAKDFYIGALSAITTVRLKPSDETLYSKAEYHEGIREKYTINTLSDVLGLL